MFLNTDNTTVREKEKKIPCDFLRVTIVTVIVTDSIMIDYDRFEGTNVAAIIAITHCTYAFNRVIRIIGESSAESYDYFVYNFLKLFLN